MSDLRKAAQQALEALIGAGDDMDVAMQDAFVALRASLAQPEPEPVVLETVYETIIHWDESGGKRSRRDLARRIVSLFAAPPQRKPLTYVQINEIYRKARRLPKECDEYGELISASDIEFARAIEAAHGIS